MSIDPRRVALASPHRSGIAPLAMGFGEISTVPQVAAKTNSPQSATTTAVWQPPIRLHPGPSGTQNFTKGGGGGGGGSGGSGGSGGPSGAPGGPGAPGAPAAPPGTPGAAPVTTVVPDLAAFNRWVGQQQQQQQYVAQNVSVPVNVSMAPTSSYTVGPPPPQDMGPMVPASVGEGMSNFMTSKCVQYAAIGAFVAYLLKRRG